MAALAIMQFQVRRLPRTIHGRKELINGPWVNPGTPSTRSKDSPTILFVLHRLRCSFIAYSKSPQMHGGKFLWVLPYALSSFIAIVKRFGLRPDSVIFLSY